MSTLEGVKAMKNGKQAVKEKRRRAYNEHLAEKKHQTTWEDVGRILMCLFLGKSYKDGFADVSEDIHHRYTLTPLFPNEKVEHDAMAKLRH